MRTPLLLACLLFAVAPALAGTPKILVLGDSISAAHGIAAEDGWVARLQRRLGTEGYPHEVVNASISGDTTSGGRSRLPDLLDRHDPRIVVIQLGGNDGLRGLAPGTMRDNLAAMIERTRDAGARVLLAGIRLPPNYGRAYIERFMGVYRDIADEYGVAFVPKLLAGVGGREQWMQSDGIHPNAEGQARILDNVWPQLEGLLEAKGSSRKRSPRRQARQGIMSGIHATSTGN